MKYLFIIFILFFGELASAKSQGGSALEHQVLTKNEVKTKIKSQLKLAKRSIKDKRKKHKSSFGESLCKALGYAALMAFIHITLFVTIIPFLVILGLVILVLISWLLDPPDFGGMFWAV